MKNQNLNHSESAYGGTRPMKVVVDNNGNWWLCDKQVEDSGNLAGQGCWNYADMAFDRND